MPVPKPVVRPIVTKKGTSQTSAKPKATTPSTTKKATTSKKQSCDINYPFGSPYHTPEPVKNSFAEIKKHATIVEEYSGKNCMPVKKCPNKNKMTTETTSNNAKPLKKDLAKKSTSTMTCSGEKCYLEPPKKAPVKVTKSEGSCYAEPAKKAQVKKITDSKEPACCTESNKMTQPKSTSKKTAESAVRKLMLPTTRKSKTDCASGWCNWDSDMSTDGSEGCACGMCSFDDSDCDEVFCHLTEPKKKITTKKTTKSTSNANKKCYLYK